MPHRSKRGLAIGRRSLAATLSPSREAKVERLMTPFIAVLFIRSLYHLPPTGAGYDVGTEEHVREHAVFSAPFHMASTNGWPKPPKQNDRRSSGHLPGGRPDGDVGRWSERQCRTYRAGLHGLRRRPVVHPRTDPDRRGARPEHELDDRRLRSAAGQWPPPDSQPVAVVRSSHRR